MIPNVEATASIKQSHKCLARASNRSLYSCIHAMIEADQVQLGHQADVALRIMKHAPFCVCKGCSDLAAACDANERGNKIW
jgi:hypothetical protein